MRARLDEMVRAASLSCKQEPSSVRSGCLMFALQFLGTGSRGGTRHKTLGKDKLTAWPQTLFKLHTTLLLFFWHSLQRRKYLQVLPICHVL